MEKMMQLLHYCASRRLFNRETYMSVLFRRGWHLTQHWAQAFVPAKSLQLCLTLWDSMDCSPPGSSVHGVPQARIVEWVAMPSSRGIFLTRGLNLCLFCLLHGQVGSLPLASHWEAQFSTYCVLNIVWIEMRWVFFFFFLVCLFSPSRAIISKKQRKPLFLFM